ncbi:uncharacterized protein LOC144198315 isoform X3 [Stigmatopora nigra]
MSKSHGAPHVYLRLQVHPKIFNSGKMELTSAGIVKTASPHKDHGRCWTIAKPTMGTRLGCTSTSAKSLQTDPEDGQSREEAAHFSSSFSPVGRSAGGAFHHRETNGNNSSICEKGAKSKRGKKREQR